MHVDFAGPGAAFVAGLTASVHCAGMCGPLACALRVRPLEYHGGRLLTYSLAGALAGALGGGVLAALQSDSARLLPWLLGGVLLLIGLGWERKLPAPPLLGRYLLKARLNRTLGFFTPLLPCTPLWLMLGVAAASGAPQLGLVLMAAFVLGTIPLPLLLQQQLLRWQGRLSPSMLRWGQQGMALLGAGLLVWRALLPSHGCCH